MRSLGTPRHPEGRRIAQGGPRAHDLGRLASVLLASLFVLANARAETASDSEPTPATVEPPSESGRATPPARSSAAGIEEITITARKREESLQDTPLAVTAFSTTDLQDAGAVRADDIGRLTPNLQFQQSAADQNSARLQIRGVGTADPISSRDPGVGIYVDGFYLARAQGQLVGLADIERIEVLRGPQGTLFGRNTVGGAVSIVTRKPSDEYEAEASVRLGTYNLFESRGSLNIPLVPEKAALRVSFQTMSREGYTKNRLLGQETDDRRLLAGRLALRLNPTEAFEILLTGEQTRSHSAGRGGECRSVPEALPNAPLINGLEQTGFMPVANCLANEADNEFDFLSAVRSKENLDTYGLTSTMTWDLDSLTAKSLTAWRRQEVDANRDFTLAREVVGNVIDEGQQFDQISQEFNLSGLALDGRLQWTAGAFGFYEKVNPGLSTSLVGMNLCQALQPLIDAGAVPPEQGLGACGASSLQRLPRLKTLALSGYGQLTYDVMDRLHLTAGLRYSAERKEFSAKQFNFTTPTTTVDAFAGLPGGAFGTRSERFGKWTPLLTLAYDVSEDAMVYATYSKGFKSGGFNGRPNANVPASLLPFEQEELDNFEVGLKASWLDNRLVTNVSAFYGIYDDIQQTVLSASPAGDFASRVANAGEAVVSGAEVELRAVPAPGLDLRASFGFTDAEYREFEDTARGPVVNGVPTTVPINRRNEEFFNTPSFTMTLSAGYTFYDLGPLGDATARLNWYHQDEVNYGPASDTLEVGKYGLLSGQLRFALPDGKTEIVLFGENLLNRTYVDSGINFEDGFAASLAYYGPPRMVGIEIRRSF